MSLHSICKLFLVSALLISLGGCMRGCTSSRPPIHPNPNMDNQPKYRPQAASAFFYDGATMRPQVEGTVAQGELQEDTGFYQGTDDGGSFIASSPIAVDDELRTRGGQRYEIYCTPCHGGRGNGKGVLWERAQIQSADLHEDRIVQMPDGELFDIITNGKGLMSGYKYPIPPRDRWAIIAYVRALQQGAAGS